MMRRCFTAVVVVLGMAGTGLAAAVPAASAASTTCLVVDANINHSYTSLQDAVTAAAPGDTLFVKGTCTGTTEIGKNLTISGHSASGKKTATLSGGFQGNVLTIDGGTTVTLNTLIITNGQVGLFGGGIYNGGTVTVNGSTITGNTAGNIGGGIANYGTITLNGSIIGANNADDTAAGGIYNAPGHTVTLNGSTITGNKALFGGGIYNDCGTLVNAVAGTGGNVYGNTPDDIFNVC